MKASELFEMPYLVDDELQYQVLAKISNTALKRSYQYLCKDGEIEIFAGDETGFIAGYKRPNHLSTVVMISCRATAYPVVPTQLQNYQQVSMVNVSKEFADKGFTKSVYNQIAKTADFVSDHEQYLGAKGLWKSLARESDINVYVYDGHKGDYIRDASGVILKYHSKNIEDKVIWGSSEMYRTVLLVTTSKELK